MDKKNTLMNTKRMRYITAFLVVNLLAVVILSGRESMEISSTLSRHAQNTKEEFQEILDDYQRSFRVFAQMMGREIQNNPDPDKIWDYLKSIDKTLLEIEGNTFDGLYMYYKDRYLYSWDTPYSQYEQTGYQAKERPWYKEAAEGMGSIVFTPPYMSYANHYILTTISQLQPDGETVFAYDIKMGDIQELVNSITTFENEQTFIFDREGTVVGSTNTDYLGGNLYAQPDEAQDTVRQVQEELDNGDENSPEEIKKIQDRLQWASAFRDFRTDFSSGLSKTLGSRDKVVSVKLDGKSYYAYTSKDGDYSFLILVPVLSILKKTLNIWLIPLLLVELLLVYVLGRISKEEKNRELRQAYIELGQTQKRLEIALNAAQKAAAIDDLTGIMNFKSFRKAMMQALDEMEEDAAGILIMIDGDHFKQVNDTYGHNVGDDVIKLTAQMIIGRIRTVDLASRLHGDEFAIFVADTCDYSVACRIMEDINKSIAKEAARRNMPSITLSAGAVVARSGDNYTMLAKAADEALYRAKESHNGGFASC